MEKTDIIQFNERAEHGHIQYRCKCMYCWLHFTVFSYYKDWADKVGNVTCPECGHNDEVRVLNSKPSKKHIFQKVPGSFRK